MESFVNTIVAPKTALKGDQLDPIRKPHMIASQLFLGKLFFVLKKGFLTKSIGKPFLSTKLALKSALTGNQ